MYINIRNEFTIHTFSPISPFDPLAPLNPDNPDSPLRKYQHWKMKTNSSTFVVLRRQRNKYCIFSNRSHGFYKFFQIVLFLPLQVVPFQLLQNETTSRWKLIQSIYVNFHDILAEISKNKQSYFLSFTTSVSLIALKRKPVSIAISNLVEGTNRHSPYTNSYTR